jgi:glycerol kinase
MQAILTIDQGTTGTTCLVMDGRGHVLGRAYVEIAQHFPRPGWVEHDAAEIWEGVIRTAREALAAAGARPGAIGITNQRETVVLWDRTTGEPLHRAIVWQDRRTAERCAALRTDGAEGWIRERTGLVLDPYFSATKLEWLLDQIPGARRRAEAGELAAGTVDSWLIWKMTGGRVHATDPTNASRTLLYDIERHTWDDELLATFRIPRAILPEVRPSSGDFGVAAGELFGAAAPIAGVAGDQQAALFGQGAWRSGLAKNTYGTGAFLLLHTGTERRVSMHGLLTTVACGPRGEAAYALEGSIFVAGAAVQWLRDGLGIITSAAETEALARELESNDGVYFVPAFVGLGAPWWDPDVRGTIVGLTQRAGRAHLARAALEAMAYATHDVLSAMEADAGVRTTTLAADGGAAANDWLMQFQADILDLPVRRSGLVETTALGAALLAGIATGIVPDADAFLAAQAAPSHFEPGPAVVAQRERLLQGWRAAVGAAREWAAGAGASDAGASVAAGGG